MALQSSGQISLSNIASQFNISTGSPISYNSLYGKTAGVPLSGQISLSNFYAKRNFAITLTTQASDLGVTGMSPWFNASPIDPSMRLVWNTSGAAASAPFGWVQFQFTYFNSNSSAISATQYVAADNIAKSYVNKQFIRSNTTWVNPIGSSNITLQPGSNLLEWTVCNAGSTNNPAMLGFCATNNIGGAIILRSDNFSSSNLTGNSRVFCSSTTFSTEPIIS